MSDDIQVLKNRASKNRSRSHTGGLLVLFGLIIEVILALIFRKGDSFFENWGPIIADAFVAIGVWTEIHFAGQANKSEDELQRKSEEKIAELNAHAKEAELKTEEIRKQLAPRSITREQFNAIQELKGQTFKVIIYSANDSESVSFAKNIFNTLHAAELNVAMATILMGGISGNGIVISFSDSITDINSHPLFLTFKKLDLISYAMNRYQYPMNIFPDDHIVIMVFEK